MKRSLFYLLGILLTIIIGTYLYHWYCCNCSYTKGCVKDVVVAEKTAIESEPNQLFTVKETEKKTIEKEVNDPAEEEWDCQSLFEKPFLLYFNIGQSKTTLSAQQQKEIDEIAACVIELGIGLHIVGHTDNTGNANANIVIGQQRANTIKNLLIEKGVSANLVTTSSRGETVPISDNNSPEGRAKNRRIELIKQTK